MDLPLPQISAARGRGSAWVHQHTRKLAQLPRDTPEQGPPAWALWTAVLSQCRHSPCPASPDLRTSVVLDPLWQLPQCIP